MHRSSRSNAVFVAVGGLAPIAGVGLAASVASTQPASSVALVAASVAVVPRAPRRLAAGAAALAAAVAALGGVGWWSGPPLPAVAPDLACAIAGVAIAVLVGPERPGVARAASSSAAAIGWARVLAAVAQDREPPLGLAAAGVLALCAFASIGHDDRRAGRSTETTALALLTRLGPAVLLIPLASAWAADRSGLAAGPALAVSGAVNAVVIGALFARTLADLRGLERERTRIAGRLAEREHLLATIVDSSGDAILSVDRDDVITSWNRGAERLFGCSAADAIGTPATRFVPDALRDELTAVLAAVHRGETVSDVPTRRIASDGAEIDVAFNASPIHDPDSGAQIGVAKIVRDLSQATLSGRVFERVVESTPCGMLLVAADGAITYANAEAARMLGYLPGELVGMNVDALVPVALSGRHAALRARYAEAPSPRAMGLGLELRALRKDRSEVRIEVGLSPLDLRGAKVLVSLIDVSGRVEARDALIRAKAELETQVAQRTESLVRSNQDLERFAYVASHDLQEPMRMVASYTSLLADELGDQLTDDTRTYLRFALDGAKRMQRLLDDLLQYSRVAVGRTVTALADTDAALDAALANLHLAIEESTARIERSPLPPVAVDHTQLVQLLQNLIGNALKFAGDAPPRVEIGAVPGDRFHELFVRDHGIGLDMKYARDIFLLFRRLHKRDAFAGTGLGLAITQRIVSNAGGQVWVESVPGQGATFRFTLPAHAMDDMSESPAFAARDRSVGNCAGERRKRT